MRQHLQHTKQTEQNQASVLHSCFFLRNIRAPNTPSLWQEPEVEEMVVARDSVRAARATKEEDRPWLPPLEVGDLVVGQNPKSSQWTMAGEVSTVTHGGRAYWV